MIVLLNVSNRRKYCTIRLQLNNSYKAEFDCLKTDSIDVVLKKAAKTFAEEEMNSKMMLFKMMNNPNLLEEKLKKIKKTENKSHKIDNLFTISNVTKGGLSNDKLNDYEIKMNNTVVGSFKHDRNQGLSKCLEIAAENISDFETSQLLTKSLFYKKEKTLKNN